MLIVKVLILAIMSSLVILFYRLMDNHLKGTMNLNNYYTKMRNSNRKSWPRKENLESDVSVSKISEIFQRLSDIVQKRLLNLQRRTDCDGPNLICQYRSQCGFGCQIHHRILCLSLSFVMNVSLIQNKASTWPYIKKWEDKFKQVENKNCQTNSKTMFLKTAANPPQLIVWKTRKRINYPIENGIPLPSEIFEDLLKIHRNPFLWLIGQFAHFSLRLLPKEESNFLKSKKLIGFQSPIVGLHVRRTDKLREKPQSFHPIQAYITEAERYFQEIHLNYTKKRVFVASEDSTILEEVRIKFEPLKWTILGFQQQVTTNSTTERMNLLDDIVRDVFLLSQCDFVVCGFSSNICRLVYELIQYKLVDATHQIVSLDEDYWVQKLKSKIIMIE